MLINERPEWGPLATFVPNKVLPIYNWFYYKEGFSRDLVLNLIKEFGIKPGSSKTVLDPFCGVGTTLLACKESGIDSIGFDVHPVAVFAAKVKTRNYDPNSLLDAAKELLQEKFKKPGENKTSPLVKRAFNRHTLDDVFFFRDLIIGIQRPEIRDFILLALMNVTMKSSYAWKDGAVIKIRKHPVPPLRKLLKRQMHRMIKDLKKGKRAGATCAAGIGDARRMQMKDGSIDAVITSPPYLNKIEYTRVYSIEEELFFAERPRPSLRSYIGIESEKALTKKDEIEGLAGVDNLPNPAIAYFIDMRHVILELHRLCSPGARLGIVVGNGCLPTGVVDSDVILSRIAEHAGFKAQQILALNRRNCTRNRVEKIGVTRESLLIWEK